MAEFNGANRGFYIADNLYFLQSLNSECIDLVCIDPPFAKNETFGKKKKTDKDPLKPPLTRAEEKRELELFAKWGITTPEQAMAHEIAWPATSYTDIWSWQKDVHESWVDYLKDEYPAVDTLIQATSQIHGDGTAAYICYMAMRIAEIRRVLKPTGSLLLHCDHTAGAYLRQLLDAIFGNGENGSPGFRNEIIWHYSDGTAPAKDFKRKHDTIYRYSKSNNWKFNKITLPVLNNKRFNKTDSNGRMYFEDKRRYNPPRRYYADEGRPCDDVWTFIEDKQFRQLNSMSKERTGYPTQKPIALAERIIKATTDEGDVVLD